MRGGARAQVGLLLLQVFFVGLLLGSTRTVVPALAESEFGVPRGSVLLLSSFVVAFGLVKSVMNFAAGHLSETRGRRRVLIAGWIAALPVPAMIWAAPSWGWIVAATVLLGVNQGLAWSMTQTAKLDLTGPKDRGLILGLNEFAGYVGVALAGVATGYAAEALGARAALFGFGMAVVLAALATAFLVQETRPGRPRDGASPRTAEVFARMTWRDRRLFAVTQAGLIEKFVDALIWIALPVWLYDRGESLGTIGWVTGAFGVTWGVAQLVTGRLSDITGRFWPNVLGMWICGLGAGAIPFGEGVAWWAGSAAVSGFGMALLYPNLSAAIADLSEPDWRGTAIGIYRFWRDFGYAAGAAALGIAAQVAGRMDAAFTLVMVAMLLSGGVLFVLGRESRPQE